MFLSGIVRTSEGTAGYDAGEDCSRESKAITVLRKTGGEGLGYGEADWRRYSAKMAGTPPQPGEHAFGGIYYKVHTHGRIFAF